MPIEAVAEAEAENKGRKREQSLSKKMRIYSITLPPPLKKEREVLGLRGSGPPTTKYFASCGRLSTIGSRQGAGVLGEAGAVWTGELRVS